MKKIAIVYASIHHHNTEKLLTGFEGIDIYNVNKVDSIDLKKYDLIGLASGIYHGKLHKSIINFAKEYSKDLKEVFLVYTSGSNLHSYKINTKKELNSLGLNVIDVFSTKGYDTYGFWRIIGGIAKKHPNIKDKENFKTFILSLVEGGI